MLLDLQKVKKLYVDNDGTEHVILNDLSLQVKKAEVVSIIGPSGSGKTSLLNIIGLLDNFNSGKYLLNGKNISNIKDGEKSFIRQKHLGFIFQFHFLMNDFTVIENLIIPQVFAGKDRKEATEIALQKLESFKMADKQKSFPFQLSGGEQQRLSVIRSFINNPSLILADEPTGNLDVENTEIVFNEFIEQVRTNKTAVILVTHNFELAKKADRILCIENQKLVQREFS